LRTVRRAGPYLRVADPRWKDPLEGHHAARYGGRWNPPESFPVIYLCRDEAVARANLRRLLAPHPYGPEDLRPEAAPVLVGVTVREGRFLNVVTDAGCAAAGLPKTYPKDSRGRVVPRTRCHPLGTAAHETGLRGVAARSAAPGAPKGGEELAHFGRRGLRRGATRTFEQWFWPAPPS
jgi:hypothetical protein